MIDLTHLYQILDTADKVAEEEGLFFFVWLAKRLFVHWQKHYILDTIILFLAFLVVSLALFFMLDIDRIIKRKWRRHRHRKLLRKEAEERESER